MNKICDFCKHSVVVPECGDTHIRCEKAEYKRRIDGSLVQVASHCKYDSLLVNYFVAIDNIAVNTGDK